MKIVLEILTQFKNTAPTIRVSNSVDNCEFNLKNKTNTIECNLNLQSSDTISIEFLNKDDNDDNVVELKKMFVDDIDIQHFIYDGEFFPTYNTNWYNEQTIKPPKSYKPGTEMRHNGKWILNVQLPIWKMMMDNWINDDRQTS